MRAGIGAGLLRVSSGIEDSADLVADLAAGWNAPLKSSQHRILRRHAFRNALAPGGEVRRQRAEFDGARAAASTARCPVAVASEYRSKGTALKMAA